METLAEVDKFEVVIGDERLNIYLSLIYKTLVDLAAEHTKDVKYLTDFVVMLPDMPVREKESVESAE